MIMLKLGQNPQTLLQTVKLRLQTVRMGSSLRGRNIGLRSLFGPATATTGPPGTALVTPGRTTLTTPGRTTPATPGRTTLATLGTTTAAQAKATQAKATHNGQTDTIITYCAFWTHHNM